MRLSGAFYDGGADQGAFDAYVAAQRRQLGIMADRGAETAEHNGKTLDGYNIQGFDDGACALTSMPHLRWLVT